MTRPTHIDIDLDALHHNLGRVRAAAPGSRVMTVVKANAYGHGLVRVAWALADAGTDGFGVACLDEALTLRRAGISQPITLLEGHFQAAELSLAAEQGLDLMLHRPWQVESLLAARLSRPLHVWLKLDTGMHRLGFYPDQIEAAARRLRACHGVQLPLGLATHLACADEPGFASTGHQLALFRDIATGWDGPLSAANSAGVLAWPESHGDWLRPGIMLYGASPIPSTSAEEADLRPVMTFRSALISVKQCVEGDAIGYGGTWVCPEAMPVGVVAVGYGDGYPRAAPAGTPVLLDGQRVPLIGRISMDMITVDLRGYPRARPGTPVVLWGRGLPVDEVAAAAGTIPYELLCRIAVRAKPTRLI